MKIASVIKWDIDGNSNKLIYKYPEEDFNYLTQLIVHESQQAFFLMNGEIFDVFGPGRYTLETENIPLLTKSLNRFMGDKNPFHCEVYFANMTEQMAIKWGTDSKIQILEPENNIPFEIGMHGDLSISINNAKKLILKLVGSAAYFTNEKFVEYSRSIINKTLKPYIATNIKNNKISIFEIDQYLDIFSNGIKNLLIEDFNEYGISLNRFDISAIEKPINDELYQKYKQINFSKYANIERANIEQKEELIRANTEAQKKIIDSKAEAEKRIQEGYTYQQQRSYDIAQDIAKNEAKGQISNIGVGMGAALGISGKISNLVGDSLNKIEPINNVIYCPYCGNKLEQSFKYCGYCGNKIGD